MHALNMSKAPKKIINIFYVDNELYNSSKRT